MDATDYSVQGQVAHVEPNQAELTIFWILGKYSFLKHFFQGHPYTSTWNREIAFNAKKLLVSSQLEDIWEQWNQCKSLVQCLSAGLMFLLLASSLRDAFRKLIEAWLCLRIRWRINLTEKLIEEEWKFLSSFSSLSCVHVRADLCLSKNAYLCSHTRLEVIINF